METQRCGGVCRPRWLDSGEVGAFLDLGLFLLRPFDPSLAALTSPGADEPGAALLGVCGAL